MSATGMKIAIFGAGAVGSTIGGWLAGKHADLWFVDLPPVVESLKEKGLTLYCHDTPTVREHTRARAVEKLTDIPGGPDAILLCVKNYSLDAVSRMIAGQIGRDRAIVVGFQNGVENQAILPKHFSRVVYGIVGYNCWIDEPGVVGYQKKGPLVLGTPDNSRLEESRAIAAILSRGVETVVTERLQDAAHSKMIVNLTNSLTTLVGHRFKPVSDPAIFQKLLTRLTAEGTRIVEAAGYREERIGGMPSWRLMRAAAALPRFMTRRKFEQNVKKMVVSSMAQDILQRGSTDSELDSLNGYFLSLADKHGVAAPYNRAVYRLCKERFGKPGFQPLDVREVWDAVRAETARA